MWRETTKHERNQRIFEVEFAEFLPDRILDFHVHVYNEGVVPQSNPFSCGGHPTTRYDYNDLEQDLAECYPGRDTYAVCFGLPIVGYDRVRNNEYLARESDRQRFFPLRLLDPHEDNAEILQSDLESGTFCGLKPYPDYVRKANVNEVEIPEMLPGWAMEIADAMGLIIMLHIPRKARLADPLNQRQIVELAENYPRVKIVLAHIGRAYYLKNALGNLDALKDVPNLYFDLAMVNHWEVMEHLFQRVPVDRILYGSDAPIALAPGKSVEINDQYTYVTPTPWALSISDDHGKLTFTSFLYEELRAIKHAVERLGLGKDFVEALFFGSGMKVLGKV
ncbi:MAG: amidohydrolase family protein [Candidatus Hydrogenedentes bacterium]|nr:amidohydrolase family protein [Candidatus Hydrogenedentota bacterium]